MKQIKKVTFVIICASHFFTAYTQDIGSVNVDFLSDAQVLQYWERAQSEGYEITQVRDLAISRGMAAAQADKLVERITSLTSGEEGSGVAQTFDLRQVSGTGGLESFLDGSEPEIVLSPFEKKLFGYKVFKLSQSGSGQFAPNFNMATPESYVLGPSDELSVEIYGSSEGSYSLVVSADGKIAIPRVGPIPVNGLTIAAARLKVRRELSKIYKGLAGSNPTVFLELALVNIRSIKVNIVGEVSKPGTYAIPSFSSVFNLLYAAGGPTITGTFRNIQHYRGGKLLGNIDLYDHLSGASLQTSTLLRDEDLIVVGPYGKRVEVEGLVKLPGVFEVIEGESIEDVIQRAGGFMASALKKSVTLKRSGGSNQMVKDILLPGSDFILEDEDLITVREAIDLNVSRVQVEGAVLNPGEYGWFEGITIADLVTRAGGVTPDSYLAKATLFRKKADLTTEALDIDLNKQLDSTSLSLESEDLLLIARRSNLVETKFVQVSGEVNNSGIFPFFDGMTIADALLLSSGLRNSAYGGKIEWVTQPDVGGEKYFVRELDIPSQILSFDHDSFKQSLKPYDHIFIRQVEGFNPVSKVEVRGEVMKPGEYVLEDRITTFDRILERCGGTSEYAFLEGSFILRLSEENDDIELAKQSLRRLKNLNAFVNQEYINQSLSPVERASLNARIVDQQAKYEAMLVNSGRYSSEDTLAIAIDSVNIDSQIKYDKIAFLKSASGGNGQRDFELRDGDIIVIPRKPQTVRISGEVLTEEAVTRYRKGRSFQSYIGEAGGFTPLAKGAKAYVVYADGSAEKTRNFLFFRKRPKIEPGSEIIIPGGRVREVFNLDRVLALTTTVLNTYLLFLVVQDRTP